MNREPIREGTLNQNDAPWRRSALAGALAEAAIASLEIAGSSPSVALHARVTDLPGEIARRADTCTITAADATLIKILPHRIQWRTSNPLLANALSRHL